MASIIKVDTIQTAAGGTPTAADLGLNTTGSVLQVVTVVKSVQQAIQSTSFTTISSLSPSITPSSSSSKILVMVNLNLDHYQNGNGTSSYSLQLLRGSTVILSKHHDHYAGTASNGYRSFDGDGTIVYLDSPSTTSEITYTVQGKSSTTGNTDTTRISNNDTDSTMTLMEIAG